MCACVIWNIAFVFNPNVVGALVIEYKMSFKFSNLRSNYSYSFAQSLLETRSVCTRLLMNFLGK